MLLVAPATANILGKFALGLADDFLSTMYLAFRGPVIVAPAMNNNMWEHEAVRANIRASVDHLRHGSQVLEELIQRDGLLVVGAEYSLESGVVEFFEP